MDYDPHDPDTYRRLRSVGWAKATEIVRGISDLEVSGDPVTATSLWWATDGISKQVVAKAVALYEGRDPSTVEPSKGAATYETEVELPTHYDLISEVVATISQYAGVKLAVTFEAQDEWELARLCSEIEGEVRSFTQDEFTIPRPRPVE